MMDPDEHLVLQHDSNINQQLVIPISFPMFIACSSSRGALKASDCWAESGAIPSVLFIILFKFHFVIKTTALFCTFKIPSRSSSLAGDPAASVKCSPPHTINGCDPARKKNLHAAIESAVKRTGIGY
jgi:hypothetical protein